MNMKICLICKKEFVPKQHTVGKYCSLPCYYSTKKGFTPIGVKERVGEKSPKWKGGKPKCLECGILLSWYNAKRCMKCHALKEGWQSGIRSENFLERKKFHRKMQKKVFERDNYTCQICNQRGGTLHVDHIQPFAEYLEGRFEMNNCRTLCRKCHYFITWKKSMPENSKWGIHFMKEVN